MKRALKETIIFGLPTNIEFLKFLLSHPQFVKHQMDINSVKRLQSSDWKTSVFPLPDGLMKETLKELKSLNNISPEDISFNPWSDFKK